MNIHIQTTQSTEPAIALIPSSIVQASAQNPDPVTKIQAQTCQSLKQGNTPEQALTTIKSELATLETTVIAFYAQRAREEQGAQGRDLDIVAQQILDSAIKDCCQNSNP
jgi:hypothetical protein